MTGKVLLVGCGNMGFAMLQGWLDNGVVAAGEVTVVEPDEALRERAGGLGVAAHASAETVPGSFAIVLFAVKPQMMAAVVPAYRRFVDAGSTVVSIAAGTRMATFENLLGNETPVVRIMPNTPAAVGKGMLVACDNSRVEVEFRELLDALMAANGRGPWIGDEALMAGVTAVSGSGPAYLFHFIECLTAAAEATGLPADTAALLARQTVVGAAALAEASADDPATLRRNVTSPGGTTAAALGVLMGEDRLKTLMTAAVEAARRRGVELAE